MKEIKDEVRIPESERVLLENLYLKQLLLAFREKGLVDELQKVQAQRQEAQKALSGYVKTLRDKHTLSEGQEIDPESGKVCTKSTPDFIRLLHEISMRT